MLIGGALWLTVVGYPIVEGHQIESIDNTHNGFPIPLPRWNDLTGKIVQGIFAIVIDFFYFVFPLLIGGVFFLCSTIAFAISRPDAQSLRTLAGVMGTLVALWLTAMWFSSVSPVGKALYVSEGQPGLALSPREILRRTWTTPARSVYLRARLHSLPPYLAALGLMAAAWWSASWSGWLGLLIAWIALAALVYARLITIQLYFAAAREVERGAFEALQARLSR